MAVDVVVPMQFMKSSWLMWCYVDVVVVADVAAGAVYAVVDVVEPMHFMKWTWWWTSS